MTTVQFRFAADVLRRLGEELNPSIDQGIVELAKNSYDADATECVISLEGVHEPGGRITVSDNGDGMQEADIINGWLILGRSQKQVGKLSRLGRLPAGSKGLGRLAALRLGRQVDLRTRSREKPAQELRLQIDWDEFDKADIVEDVPLSLTHRTSRQGSNGTDVTVNDLRSRIGRNDVKRLARSLLLLADPFDDEGTSFRPRLLSDEFEDLAKLVEARYFPEADYHLHAVLDHEGRISVDVLDPYDGVLYHGDHDEISGDSTKRYGAPSAVFDLWVFLLSAENFRMRAVSLAEVREWLGQFGGVHLYLNGLRVAPYGNPNNDWLDMNLARVRSPETRPGTNTSIGRLSVSDPDDVLVQKTDRSGLIETAEFSDLRQFAVDALEFMAKRRLADAERRRRNERGKAKKTTSRSRQRLAEAIESTPKPQQAPLRDALDRYERATNRELGTLRREVQLYRTLSTAGITAATFAHESAGSPLKVIGQALGALERRGPREFGERFQAVLGDQLAGLRKAVKSLSVLGSVTLSLVEADKRRQRRVDLHLVITKTRELFLPFLDQRQVDVELDLSSRDASVRGSEAAVESIITNLLNNALVAFEDSSTTHRRIRISTEIIGDVAAIRVEDNGPGIRDVDLGDIWLPGVTTREHGTGLGLTIVRDVVADLGGSTEARANGALGGADFTVELPLLGD